MRKAPIVGVTRCSRMDDYVESVEAAGGVVRIVDTADLPEAVLEGIDALVLTGGGDVDPALYGAPRHPATHDAEAGRDALELALARGAMERDLPLLAICRGMQVLNVAAGGTLIQDIPTEQPTVVPHRVESPKDAVAHVVRIEPGSRLAAMLGREGAECWAVNSRHHQAVRTIAASLVPSASAPDGLVEAVERPALRFCVGVQWHPENFWRTGEFRGLFDGLIRASFDTRPVESAT